MTKSSILLIFIILFAFSCRYDNVEETYKDFITDCDTSVVSYSMDIAPIIDINCIVCHGSVSPEAGLDLSTYGNVFANRENIRNRINRPLGDPFVMPQGGPMVQCNIDKINAWINQGALNN